jgi:hypothetical protein
MARLAIPLLAILVVLALGALATLEVRGAVVERVSRLRRNESGVTLMRRVAFVLLLALIVYVAVWGGA